MVVEFQFKKSINLDDLNFDILDEVNFHFFSSISIFWAMAKIKRICQSKGDFHFRRFTYLCSSRLFRHMGSSESFEINHGNSVFENVAGVPP